MVIQPSTRGTVDSHNWSSRLVEKPVARSYRVLDYDWTPLSQNPGQKRRMRPPPDCRPTVGASAPKGTCRRLSSRGGCAVRAALKYNSYRAAGWILCRRLKYATGYCKWQSGLAATIHWDSALCRFDSSLPPTLFPKNTYNLENEVSDVSRIIKYAKYGIKTCHKA